MKTEVKKLDKCQVELTVKIDADELKAVVKDVEKVFVREAKLPGFRPGKIPLELIRKEFADGLKKETERMMYQRNIAEAIKAEKIDDVSVVDVKDVVTGAEGGSFTAVVEIKPEFKLPTYKGLKLTSNEVAVSDAELDEQMNRLRAAYAIYEDAKEGEAVADGDFVQIDYSGTIGGKAIAEINPEAKFVSSAEGYWTQVEEGRFLPEILDALKGMKAGETKDAVEAKFSKESAPEGLKGETAVYKLTLKSFRRRILPDDATFAEKAKAESVEALRAKIKENMLKHATESEAARRENEAIDLILKKCDFEVPMSQVRYTMDGYLRQLAERAQYSGLGADYFEQNREKIMKDAEENATNQVRLWYILDAIAKEENIEADEKERGKKVVEFILANAKN